MPMPQGTRPTPEQVADGIWPLPQHNEPGHMPFMLSYLIQDSAGGIHVVDPGWDLTASAGILRGGAERGS